MASATTVPTSSTNTVKILHLLLVESAGTKRNARKAVSRVKDRVNEIIEDLIDSNQTEDEQAEEKQRIQSAIELVFKPKKSKYPLTASTFGPIPMNTVSLTQIEQEQIVLQFMTWVLTTLFTPGHVQEALSVDSIRNFVDSFPALQSSFPDIVLTVYDHVYNPKKNAEPAMRLIVTADGLLFVPNLRLFLPELGKVATKMDTVCASLLFSD